MSTIDLKHATIYVEDGYAGLTTGQSAAVNLMAGYTAGAVTMAVDGITGIIPNGDRFLVAGDTVEHVVTSHSETLGNTTSITFTPALGAPVVDGAAIDWLSHSLEVSIGEGNCTFDESRNIEYKLNRGKLDDVREGNEVPMDVKLDAEWDFLRSPAGATIPTIEEALKKLGPAASWISSDPDQCRPYAVNIRILYVPPCGGVAKEQIILRDYRYEKLNHDPKAATLSTTGKCNVTQAEVSRIAVA
jgi:hypothetical protein